MAGIYLHIPFCKQACNYCNFHFSTSLNLKESLLDAIMKELVIQKQYLDGLTIETVYFGGGTPSLLSINELMNLWKAIEANFPNQNLKEVTLEANPDNLSKEYLKALAQSPINRLSIGVQSFHEADLLFMNRAHTASEADYAIKAAQDIGFENISLDLIYGTPTMDNPAWLQNIKTALQLSVPHISAYALTVEPQTQLAHAIKKGKVQAPKDAQAMQQFEQMVDLLLAAGFDHYEISNFGLPGKHAVHNTNYWNGVHYLGVGPSAHSFNGNQRQWNIANNALYIKGLLVNHQVPFEKEDLSFENRVNEYIMTSLRTMWGIDLAYLDKNFGDDVKKSLNQAINPFLQNETVMLNNNHYVLTKKGKFLADGIAADLFL